MGSEDYRALTEFGWVGADFVFPDLGHPDTCAAFDRRLALRLGAPEASVAEGVMFYPCPDEGSRCWLVRAGTRWSVSLTGDDFDIPDDPLLARVRAWKSVEVAK